MEAVWITVDSMCTETNMYCFEKTFKCKKNSEFNIKISADTRYQLFVNDRYVCEGPCQGSEYDKFYEQTDVSEFLIEGENSIKVYVLHITDNVFTTTFPQKTPALLFDGILECGGKKEYIVSSSDWNCARIKGIRFYQGDNVFYSMPHFEYHSLSCKREKLNVVKLCDTLADSNSCDPYGVMNTYRLSERKIPLMKTYDKVSFLRKKETDEGYIFDSGKYTTAKIKVKVSGKTGDVLKITYGECYKTETERGVFQKGDRASMEGVLQGPSDYIELSENTREIEFFWYRAFRFIELSCNNKQDLCVEIEYYPFFYPLDVQADFTCSDERFNKMWDVSVNTIKCCMHELLVDCPFYEQQQYGMDGYLQSLFLMRLSDDYKMVRKIIDDLSKSQQHDGFLCSNYPARYQQIIPTFSIYWLMLLHDYLIHTNDKRFVKKYLGAAEKIIQGFENNIDENGLVKSIYWPYVDWAGNWKIGVPGKGREEPIAVYSMIYSTGLKYASEIMERFERDGLADEYRKLHKKLNSSIERCFKNKDYYNDTLTAEEFSQHTGIWAVLSGIANGEKAVKIIDKVINYQMVSCSFSMGYFLFRALEKTGMYNENFKFFDGFLKMIDLNCTTWCENPDKPRSECHGWSAVPIYEFSAMILGVQPVSDGFEEITIKPNLGELDWAKGHIPTPYGKVYVEAKKTSDGVNVCYCAPDEIKVITDSSVRVRKCGNTA